MMTTTPTMTSVLLDARTFGVPENTTLNDC